MSYSHNPLPGVLVDAGGYVWTRLPNGRYGLLTQEHSGAALFWKTPFLLRADIGATREDIESLTGNEFSDVPGV